MRARVLAPFVLAALVTAACGGSAKNSQQTSGPPSLKSVSPSSALLGAGVTIHGSGFTPDHNAVGFINTALPVWGGRHVGYVNDLSSSDGKTLQFRLPDNSSALLAACPVWQLKTGEACPDVGLMLPLGESELFVVNDNGESNHVTFTVLAGAPPTATAQAVAPVTPVEEVLTPPPDIDTSGWLTYRDEANDFELKYPPAATVKPDTKARSWFILEGYGTQIFVPITAKTSLGSKFLFVTAGSGPSDTCVPSQQRQERTNATLVRSPNAVFWRGRGGGAGLSHWLEIDDYLASHGARCVRLQAVLEGVDPGVSHLPAASVGDMSGDVFLAMIVTFRWLN